ncbi:hypothetical protein, partial [Propionivibrio sp.]|uniref:hypothetical protein n=1 Tax=Propionivibrio sp. TaxID=2212460 RepID=UPI003BEFA699
MALAHTSITQIPNNEPDAIPSLWNTRYVEIDDNFSGIDSRISTNEAEINTARGSKGSLGLRLDDMTANISVTSVDMQNMSVASIMFAIDQAALANRSINVLRKQAQQEGEFTILNKGIKSGCVATKSTNAARNLSLSAGACFANGRL